MNEKRSFTVTVETGEGSLPPEEKDIEEAVMTWLNLQGLDIIDAQAFLFEGQ